jgi:hypothetical protein
MDHDSERSAIRALECVRKYAERRSVWIAYAIAVGANTARAAVRVAEPAGREHHPVHELEGFSLYRLVVGREKSPTGSMKD